MAKTLEDIAGILKRIHFKKKLIGGIDEQDVWRIIGKLQGEYEEMLNIDHAKSQALIEERDAQIKQLRKQVEQYRGQ